MFLTVICASQLRAQTSQPTSDSAPPNSQMVTMDFPADGVELKTLLDIVTKRLGIPILYDESVANKKIILRVPIQVPESALPGILQSALRMKGLALVDAEQPGWKQVVPAASLAAMARPTTDPSGSNVSAVTRVIALKRADPAHVMESVRGMLTQPGGNIQVVAGQKLLIVSDYAGVVERIAELAQILDGQSQSMERRFIRLNEADATQVSQTVTQLLNVQPAATPESNASGILITADDRANQVIVVAPPDRMQEISDLVTKLDQPLELQTHVYHLKTISADRVDHIMHDLLGPTAKGKYQASVDHDSGALIVVAAGSVQAQLAALLTELDVPSPAAQNPIQFYKLKNTKAADVLATVGGLMGEQGLEAFAPGSDASSADASGAASNSLPSGVNAQAGLQQSSQSRAAAPNITPLHLPQGTGDIVAMPGSVSQGSDIPSGGTGPGAPQSVNAGTFGSRYGDSSGLPDSLAGGANTIQAVHSANATVTADVNTNTIIVIAQPAVQQRYAELITRLDMRRPQVQIECTIVTLDTSENFELAVDVASAGGFGSNSILTLGSFGVSEVDAVKGLLTPVDSRGGTFALLAPGTAQVVLRALQQSARSRLVSAPRLLVNDNGQGQLQSVAQEPYSEILDTNTTQSRTGLGGEAQAGTTITVEPHISEDDYMQLGYDIELSNFTGTASNGLPPPSQKNAVSSTVTIPDGYTIVVGGLTVKNLRQAVDSIPLLGDLPVLKYLFGARSRSMEDTTLFVFIRPVILRDDKFKDLVYLSGKKAEEAGLPGDFPHSKPLPLR